jgi:hypothetical protein
LADMLVIPFPIRVFFFTQWHLHRMPIIDWLMWMEGMGRKRRKTTETKQSVLSPLFWNSVSTKGCGTKKVHGSYKRISSHAFPMYSKESTISFSGLFVSANLLQILKIDLSFDPNFVAWYLGKYSSNCFDWILYLVVQNVLITMMHCSSM